MNTGMPASSAVLAMSELAEGSPPKITSASTLGVDHLLAVLCELCGVGLGVEDLDRCRLQPVSELIELGTDARRSRELRR